MQSGKRPPSLALKGFLASEWQWLFPEKRFFKDWAGLLYGNAVQLKHAGTVFQDGIDIWVSFRRL